MGRGFGSGDVVSLPYVSHFPEGFRRNGGDIADIDNAERLSLARRVVTDKGAHGLSGPGEYLDQFDSDVAPSTGDQNHLAPLEGIKGRH